MGEGECELLLYDDLLGDRPCMQGKLPRAVVGPEFNFQFRGNFPVVWKFTFFFFALFGEINSARDLLFFLKVF